MFNADEENLNKRKLKVEEAKLEEEEIPPKKPRGQEANLENEELEPEEKEKTIAIPEKEANVQASSSAAQGEAPLNTKKIFDANTCLDTLAWLLEYNSSSCTAVCIVNGILLISDNEIDRSTTPDKIQVQYIDSIIKYFSKLLIKGELPAEERNLILKEIYLRKLKGYQQGFFTNIFENEELDEIVSAFLKNPDKKVKDIAKSTSIKRSRVLQKFAIMICREKALKRFKRVEDFLLKDAKEEKSEISKALKGSGINALEKRMIRLSEDGAAYYDDRKWLMDTEKKEYGILAVNVGAVHAELKIIDYLFACQIISSKPDDKTNYHIGISKKCCSGCFGMVDLINRVLGKEVLDVKSTHAQEPDNWNNNHPIFLLQAKKKESKKTKGKESKKTKGKENKKPENTKSSDDAKFKALLAINEGLKYANENQAQGYLTFFNKNGEELREKRKPFKSFDELKVKRGKLSEEEKKQVRVFLLRDYKLIKQICEEYSRLSANEFHKYEDKKTKPMSHTSPENSPQKGARQDQIKLGVEDAFRNAKSELATVGLLLSSGQAQPDTVLIGCQKLKDQLNSLEQHAQQEKLKSHQSNVNDIIPSKSIAKNLIPSLSPETVFFLSENQSEKMLQKIYDDALKAREELDLSYYSLELITENKWEEFTSFLRGSNITKLIISDRFPEERKQHIYLILEENIKRFQVIRNDAGGLKHRVARIFWQNNPNYDSNAGTLNGEPLTKQQSANEMLKQAIIAQKNMGLHIDNS